MDNIFDGKPSFELSHRPFFSIVVACYNSSKYLDTLLTSIVNQNLRDDRAFLNNHGKFYKFPL